VVSCDEPPGEELDVVVIDMGTLAYTPKEMTAMAIAIASTAGRIVLLFPFMPPLGGGLDLNQSI
jgi:hypothetical protein